MNEQVDPHFGAAAFAALQKDQEELRQRIFPPPSMMTRPTGSNADEWNLFLVEHKDALPFLAVQIAEAIEDAERRAPSRS